MKLLNTTVRNILALIAIIALAVATIWLVKGQTLPPSTTQAAISTLTLRPTDTLDLHPSKTNTPSPVSTSTLPPMISLATPALGPTYTPTPPIIPTATFEVLRGQAIGGYVFSEARLVPDTLGHYIQVIEWLPDADELLIIRDSKFLEVIDVNTGETQPYSDGTTRVLNPVWLPVKQNAAYLTVDEKDPTKQYLWVSDGKNSEQVFTTSWFSPVAVAPDGNGVILFDENWQLTQVGEFESQEIKLAPDTQTYAPPGYNHGELYQIAQSPDRSKAIYFNNDWLLLADFIAGGMIPIDLETLSSPDMPSIDHVQVAVWSPDSDKIAFLAAAGGMYEGNNLFVLDLQSDTLNLIVDDFHYISNLVWAFDNTQIIIMAKTSDYIELSADGYPQEGYSVRGFVFSRYSIEKCKTYRGFTG